MPASKEHVLSDAIASLLEAELAGRDRLLGKGAFASSEAEAVREGASLLAEAMRRCHPALRDGPDVQFDFADDCTAPRLAAALAFGAVTARVLAPRSSERNAGAEVQLLCAIFNLGIGLVDSVCDDDADTGRALLELVSRHDLVDASAEPRERGWLRGATPPTLARDYAVAFTVEVIETFFETLHSVYQGDGWSECRRAVGTRLEAALDAERQTLVRPGPGDTRVAELIGCSRATSVLPFQIIETIALGADSPAAGSAGTLLGEAMWRIDDLVDLCDDARSGALNGLLLEATAEGARYDATAHERLLASGKIARAAAQAAADLDSSLQQAQDDRAVDSFLYFVQRYAGIAP
jgi:hypothetical protein